MAVSKLPKSVKYFSVLFLILLAAVPVLVRFWVGDSRSGELLFGISTAFCCGAGAIIAFLLGRRLAPALPPGLPSVTFSSAVCGFTILTVVIVTVYYTYFAPVEDRLVNVNPTVSLLVKLFALGCAVYFLLLAAWMPLSEKKAPGLFLSLFPVLFCAFRILGDFIDHSTMPLASHGGYRILAIIATMLFFLQEAKFRTGKGGATWYFIIGHVAVILLSSYNVPLLWEFIRGETGLTEILYAMLSIAFIIYIFTRIYSLELETHPAEEDLPEAEA